MECRGCAFPVSIDSIFKSFLCIINFRQILPPENTTGVAKIGGPQRTYANAIYSQALDVSSKSDIGYSLRASFQPKVFKIEVEFLFGMA
jgi:hypothetical protein